MVQDILLRNGVTLSVQDSSGSKGTIIALHGLTGNHKTFHHYRNLLEQDYRFISYDLRGRGNSSSAADETSIFEHAKDLKDFIAQQKITNPILMGYSMGAYICALVASEIDVAGLILLDGAGTTEEKQRDLIVPSLSRLRKIYESKEDYVAQTRKIYETLNVKWDEVVEEITKYEVKEFEDGWKHKSEANAMEKDFNSFYAFKPEIIFLKIDCPILLVIASGGLGKKEPLFTKETYKLTIFTANEIKIVEVPANHYTLMFEQQRKVEDSINLFLEKIKKVSI